MFYVYIRMMMSLSFKPPILLMEYKISREYGIRVAAVLLSWITLYFDFFPRILNP